MNGEKFLLTIADYGLPAPVPEFKFDPNRKWRYDWAWPDKKIALEVEGAVFAQGRHTRGAGVLNDMLKYNAGVIAGWRILRCTPAQLGTSENVSDLISLLHA